MKIELHIERLILDGLPVTRAQGPQVRTAIEQELARLLAAHGLAVELQGGGAMPRVKAGALNISQDHQPAELGQRIARAVHAGIDDSGRKPAGNARPPDRGGFLR